VNYSRFENLNTVFFLVRNRRGAYKSRSALRSPSLHDEYWGAQAVASSRSCFTVPSLCTLATKDVHAKISTSLFTSNGVPIPKPAEHRKRLQPLVCVFLSTFSIAYGPRRAQNHGRSCQSCHSSACSLAGSTRSHIPCHPMHRPAFPPMPPLHLVSPPPLSPTLSEDKISAFGTCFPVSMLFNCLRMA